jgi:Uma2 family endonuclease
MSLKPEIRYTEAEYLEMELAAEEKHEFFEGEIYAMGGASFAHAQLASNVVLHLGSRLRGGPCRVLFSDLRVKVSASGLYTYPDAVVVCGDPQLEKPGDTLTNPTLLVEVLSQSTETKDRGWKFQQYQKIPSLQEYLLVSQITPRLELFTRQSDGRWLYTAAEGLEATVPLTSLGCNLQLSAVYEKVEGLREPSAWYEAEPATA